MTVAEKQLGRITRYTWPWTSDGSGDASQVFTSIAGLLVGYDCIPGGTTPTDLYDLTIVNDNSVDILATGGADQPAANGKRTNPSPAPMIEGANTLTIANAGASKNGTVVIYVLAASP